MLVWNRTGGTSGPVDAAMWLHGRSAASSPQIAEYGGTLPRAASPPPLANKGARLPARKLFRFFMAVADRWLTSLGLAK